MSILKKLTNKKDDQPAVEEKKPAKKAEKKDAPKKDAPSVATFATAHRVLVRPLLTEKTARQEARGVYSFQIAADATKIDVKRAVKEVYGTTPATVRVMNVEGKRLGRRWRSGKRADWKKALVTMPKGKTINIHEGV